MIITLSNKNILHALFKQSFLIFNEWKVSYFRGLYFYKLNWYFAKRHNSINANGYKIIIEIARSYKPTREYETAFGPSPPLRILLHRHPPRRRLRTNPPTPPPPPAPPPPLSAWPRKATITYRI